MTSGNKKLMQKAIAVVVIVALLDLVGVAPGVMLFVTGVVVVVWFITRRSQNRDLQAIFEFYVAADTILRDDERRWFAFELADVIDQGERALEVMPDPPPLQLFALGALYYKIGNHEATVEYLSRVIEDEFDEEYRVAPSTQLRRYVSMLRQLEREPAIAPLMLGAVRNLERARRKHASVWLSESRALLKQGNDVSHVSLGEDAPGQNRERLAGSSAPLPISELLQDIYHDDGGSVA